MSLGCAQGQHAVCDLGTMCSCPCHPHNAGVVQRTNGPNAISQKMCPKCQRKTQLSENFCREDGTQLVQGVGCKRCNFPMIATDKFCANCGLSKDAVIPEKPANAIPQPEESSVSVDS